MDKVVFAESDIIVHGIAAKLVSNWEKHFTYQKLGTLRTKRIYMLTNLKVSSFACKYVFYRQEHNANENPMELNFEVLEMQK